MEEDDYTEQNKRLLQGVSTRFPIIEQEIKREKPIPIRELVTPKPVEKKEIKYKDVVTRSEIEAIKQKFKEIGDKILSKVQCQDRKNNKSYNDDVYGAFAAYLVEDVLENLLIEKVIEHDC